MLSLPVNRPSLYAVVMAGGAGTRLWPESRQKRPKPFLPLTQDGVSLIGATINRLDGLVKKENRFVVVGQAFAQLVGATLTSEQLPPENVLLEPEGRNTAPCVAWFALEALRRDENATLIVLPSDQWINPDEAFRTSLRRAIKLVDEDPERLVTLGIKPTEPSSAFGYIEKGEPLDGEGAYAVAKFCEKPESERAQTFVESGRFLWNAGVFVWKAARILELIKGAGSDFAETIKVLKARLDSSVQEGRRADEDKQFKEAFCSAPKKSIDYAVLEHAPKVVVLAADSFKWNDVGSFAALERLGVPSASNVKVVSLSNANHYVRVAFNTSDRRKLVALGAVEDLLIVDAGDALLITRKNDDESIKQLVEELHNQGLDEFL